jgi:hypothetical protein
MLRKPSFKDHWGKGKTPTLQVNILQSIVLYGKLSKKKASDILNSNDSDVSVAMDRLLERKFIKYYDSDTSSKNPEKFYKITESGLKALLYVDHLSPQEFWKVMTLLCIVSKGQLSESQFEEHYSQFENNYLGYSIHRHFFQSWFFDDILQQWLQDDSNSLRAANDSSSISLSQVVIECLAFHGSMTCQQLIEKTNEKEKNLVKILNRYSIKPDSSFNLDLRIHNGTDSKKKKIYNEFVSPTFIIPEETNSRVTYKLSLFGVMLAIAFIRYHYIGIDSYSSVSNKRKDNSRKLNLFYKDVKLEEYYDRIACNYKEKVPLIFGKWSLLKFQLGSLLYDNFDFFIYKKARSNITDKSVWFGGNKEFYNDIQYIAQNAHDKLYSIYTLGRGISQQYKDQYQYFYIVTVLACIIIIMDLLLSSRYTTTSFQFFYFLPTLFAMVLFFFVQVTL